MYPMRMLLSFLKCSNSKFKLRSIAMKHGRSDFIPPVEKREAVECQVESSLSTKLQSYLFTFGTCLCPKEGWKSREDLARVHFPHTIDLIHLDSEISKFQAESQWILERYIRFHCNTRINYRSHRFTISNLPSMNIYTKPREASTGVECKVLIK